MESRVSLMRVNYTCGVSMGCIMTHASSRHMTSSGIITETEESKGQDMTLLRCTGYSVGSGPEAAQVPRGRAPARGRAMVTSRIGVGAGASQDSRRSSARPDLKISNLQARQRILRL
jgi:hypothetical protein